MNRPTFTRLSSVILLLCLPLLMAAQTDARDKELSERFQRFYSEMQVDSALSTLDELIALRHAQGNVEREGAARWNKIATLNNAARHDSLLVEANLQMEWFRQHELWSRFYQCWQRRCSANHDMGRMQTALREARAMLDDAQQRNNNTGRAMAYKQMGIVYYDIQQMQPAIEAFSQSIQLLRDEGDDSGILSGVYDGLCQAYDKDGQYEQELTTAREWLDHLTVVLHSHGMTTVAPVYVSAWLAHAAAHVGLKQYDQAAAALAKAEDFQAESTSALASYYINEMHTRLALALGLNAEALAYTDSTLQSGISIDDKIRELRAEALLNLGRGTESAELYRSLYHAKDSIFTRDMRSQLDEMNTLFRVDELKRAQQQSRLHYTIAIALLVVLALAIFLVLRSRTARRLAQKNHELADKNVALEEANLRVEESAKMKLDFVRNVSHEIRTPLNIINGFAQILTMPDGDMSAEEKNDMRERIQENADRITGLVDKMLELSESGSHEPIPMTSGIAAAQIAIQAAAHTDVQEHPDTSFTLNIDQARGLDLTTNEQYATRALALLLDNAFKFTRQGHVELRAERQPDCVAYVVEDTGIGIAPEQAENVFNEFVQLDSFADGTGIGLTVARSIARRLGGDIRLDTSYSGGCRFVLTLPC